MTNNLKAERTLTAEELTWRDLALQFDQHRMEALGVIRGLVRGDVGYSLAAEFLAQAPMSGRDVLEMRLQSLSTQQPMGEVVAYEVTDKLTSFEHNRVRFIGAGDSWLPSARLDTQGFSLRPLYALHPNQESGE